MFRKAIILPIFAALIQVMVFASVSNSIINPILAQQNEYSFIKKWGSEGVGFGKFAQPLAIAIDSNDDVYVTDTTSVSNQIQKFTNNGTFITSWDVLGIRDGPFTNARGIGIDSSNNVYVTGGGSPDTAVQKFTSWGSSGLGDGQFISPGWITVDSADNVYVGDFGENYRIQKFDSYLLLLRVRNRTTTDIPIIRKPTRFTLYMQKSLKDLTLIK
jgi:hypothetical protein